MFHNTIKNDAYVRAFSPSYIAIKEILESDFDGFNKQKAIEEKFREY